MDCMPSFSPNSAPGCQLGTLHANARHGMLETGAINIYSISVGSICGCLRPSFTQMATKMEFLAFMRRTVAFGRKASNATLFNLEDVSMTTVTHIQLTFGPSLFRWQLRWDRHCSNVHYSEYAIVLRFRIPTQDVVNPERNYTKAALNEFLW